MNRVYVRAFSVLLASCTSLTPVYSLANDVGAVAAVNRDMDGTPPAKVRRSLSLGNQVFRNELIETSPVGSGQLVFLDQTSLTVAPRSQIVLDEYVYDPATTSGKISLSISRGMLRLIGGRITKRNSAIIRTPVATVGVRGGMVIVEVDGNDNVRVVLLAGEFAKIEDEQGSIVYLSRPGAEAEVRGGRLAFSGVIGSEEIGAYFARLEGEGDGGGRLASRPVDEVNARTKDVARVNSEVPGGNEEQPISTSSEQLVDPEEPIYEGVRDEDQPEDLARALAAAVDTGTPDTGTPPTDADGLPPVPVDPTAPPPPPPPANNLPFPLPSAGNLNAQPAFSVNFDSIQTGSLIGINSAESFEISLPVPETSAEFDDRVNTNRIGSGLVQFAGDFFADDTSDNAGFFSFTDADGGTSTPFRTLFLGGALQGYGFADIDEGFFLTEIETVPSDPSALPERAQVTFGSASPNQLRLFAGDDGTLLPASNTVDVYRIDPNLDTETLPFDVDPFPEQVLLVGDAGELRWADQGSTAPTAGSFLGADVTQIIPRSNRDEPFTSFTVALGTIEASSDNTPVISIPIYTSEATSEGFAFIRHPVAANGVFGSEDNYIVASSAVSDGLGFAFAPPVKTEISAATGDVVNSVSDPTNRLLTRDASAAEVVNIPLPLASQDPGRLDTLQAGLFDTGAAAGFAVCSGGLCGDDDAGNFTGYYPLQAQFGGDVTVDFGSTRSPNPDNSVSLNMVLRDSLESNLALTNQSTGVDREVFRLGSTSADNGIYVDDERFGLISEGGRASVAGNDPVANQTFISASAGLVGYDNFNFPTLVTTQLIQPGIPLETAPEFARWGIWSATLSGTVDARTGLPREDIVHMGTWAAGVAPDTSLIPDTGIVSYTGITAGTSHDLRTGETRFVNGSFGLDYDFGQRTGNFRINTGDFSFGTTAQNAIGVPGDPSRYTFTQLSNTADISVRGGFLAGAGNPVAATAGDYEVRTKIFSDKHIIGVFAGDAVQ